MHRNKSPVHKGLTEIKRRTLSRVPDGGEGCRLDQKKPRVVVEKGSKREGGGLRKKEASSRRFPRAEGKCGWENKRKKEHTAKSSETQKTKGEAPLLPCPPRNKRKEDGNKTYLTNSTRSIPRGGKGKKGKKHAVACPPPPSIELRKGQGHMIDSKGRQGNTCNRRGVTQKGMWCFTKWKTVESRTNTAGQQQRAKNPTNEGEHGRKKRRKRSKSNGGGRDSFAPEGGAQNKKKAPSQDVPFPSAGPERPGRGKGSSIQRGTRPSSPKGAKPKKKENPAPLQVVQREKINSKKRL